MEFKAEFSKARSVEAPLDNLKRGLLFRKEQDGFPGHHCIRDDIRDRLRFARPGRTLDDEVLAPADIDQGAVL